MRLDGKSTTLASCSMMQPTNIDFRLEGHRFNYCVRAVIRREGAFLVCMLPGCDWCFLPGGRVRVGETSRQALERELQEELGVRITCGGLVMVVENFFPEAIGRVHELGLYYAVSLPLDIEPTDIVDPENGATFRWLAIDDLLRADLRPRLLGDALRVELAVTEPFVSVE